MNDNFPQEFKDALYKLYSKYGENQTIKQKLNILIGLMGDCCVSYTAICETEEEGLELKLSIMELDYLESIGIYKPVYR